MNIGILVTARMGSSRLKNKHFLEVEGRPVFHYLLQRILVSFEDDLSGNGTRIIIASTTDREDEAFGVFCEKRIALFRGSRGNIPLRHLQAARRYCLDGIVSVDGDDILCSTDAMHRVFDAINGGAEYVKVEGLPIGMNCFGYSTKFVETSLSGEHPGVLETGWTRIFDESLLTVIPMLIRSDHDGLRFTMDYKEDYDFFSSIMTEMGEDVYRATDQQIVDFVCENRLFEINEGVRADYWRDFKKNIRKEEDGDRLIERH